ncbi:MAG TPA: hypothetical protein VII92_17140, partial [Anaerolineae bacterium]
MKAAHAVADSFGDYLDDEITSRATPADVPSAVTIAGAVLDEDMTAHQAQGSLGQAIGDPVADTNTIYKAVVSDATGATVGVDSTTLLTRLGTPSDLGGGATVAANLSDIEGQTDDIGIAGVGLTALGDARIANLDATVSSRSTVTTAQVNTEVDTALVDVRLDELLAADSDIDGAAPPTVGSVFHELMSKTPAAFTFDQTTDSNEAIRDALTTPPTVGAIADAVWDEALAGHLGVGSTGEALNAAGAAGDPWTTALPGLYGGGTAGNIVGNNLNATVSSRSSHSAADVWAVGVRTLTGFGTLVTDIWAAAIRTIT